MGKNPSSPSPRKARTKKTTAASAIESSLQPDDQAANTALSDVKYGPIGAYATSPSAGYAAVNIDGTRTGRGRGRSRKTPVKNTTFENIPVKDEDYQVDADVGPAPKKIKTEGMSLSSSRPKTEIHIPDTPLPAHFKTKNNRRNTQPRVTIKRKLSFKGIESTEDYVRCGQGVNCERGGCGKPGCAYCFGDWNGELVSPRG